MGRDPVDHLLSAVTRRLRLQRAIGAGAVTALAIAAAILLYEIPARFFALPDLRHPLLTALIGGPLLAMAIAALVAPAARQARRRAGELAVDPVLFLALKPAPEGPLVPLLDARARGRATDLLRDLPPCLRPTSAWRGAPFALFFAALVLFVPGRAAPADLLRPTEAATLAAESRRAREQLADLPLPPNSRAATDSALRSLEDPSLRRGDLGAVTQALRDTLEQDAARRSDLAAKLRRSPLLEDLARALEAGDAAAREAALAAIAERLRAGEVDDAQRREAADLLRELSTPERAAFERAAAALGSGENAGDAIAALDGALRALAPATRELESFLVTLESVLQSGGPGAAARVSVSDGAASPTQRTTGAAPPARYVPPERFRGNPRQELILRRYFALR